MSPELEKAEQQIKKLLKIVDESDSFEDPASLSRIMVRLSYANHVVGRHLAQLQFDYRQKRSEVYNEVMQDEKAKVTHAKQKGEEAAQELEQLFDHYTNIHTDTGTFITVCQTHLRILGMEAKSQL